MCKCDMFRDEHADGLVLGDVTCELAIPTPTISPHIIVPWWVGGPMSHAAVLAARRAARSVVGNR